MAEKKEKKPVNRENKINAYKIVSIALLLILIVLLGKYGLDKWSQYKSNKVMDSLQETANYGKTDDEPAPSTEAVIKTEDTEMEEEITVSIPQKNLDWTAMAGTNQDIYAWIYVPGTKVDYPVLQHPTDDYYYLEYNIDGSRGYPGCIYTELANQKDFTDFNTVIYGHNMKNGTMFKTLHDYSDKSFFDQNRYVYIYTKEKTYVYEIYAAYIADNAHILNTNDFSKEDIRTRYLERNANLADATGNYMPEIRVGKDSHIITLSTCTGNDQERYLVQAVLLGSE